MAVSDAVADDRRRMQHLQPLGSGAQLHGTVLTSVGRMIVRGQLDAGTALVPEELCRTFGVSRTVVREVFRALEGKGLVSARPRVGTRVTPQSSWNFLDPDVIVWRLESPARKTQLQDLQELRLAVEPIAAMLVSRQNDPACLAELRQSITEMTEAMEANDVPRFTEADIRFHSVLLASSANRMFDRLSSVIATALRTRVTFGLPFLEISRQGLALHRAVAEKIAASDESARETMIQLLDESGREFGAAVETSTSELGSPR